MRTSAARLVGSRRTKWRIPACAAGSACGNSDNGAVMRVESGGKPVALVVLGQAGPSGIAVDATSVYWTNQYAGTVVKMERTGGTPTVLATGQQLATALAIDGASVYWANRGSTSGARNGAIMKVPMNGGAPKILATGQAPAGIAVDDENVYWTNASSLSSTSATVFADGEVMKVPLAGGPPVELASGQANPMGIAVDATSIYWANNGSQTCKGGASPSCSYNADGTIMRRTPK